MPVVSRRVVTRSLAAGLAAAPFAGPFAGLAGVEAAAPRIWTDFVPHHVTIRVAANVSELLEGRVLEYGSISGKTETVSERNNFRFVIYDDLWGDPINCFVK
jgi:hypothetical protein